MKSSVEKISFDADAETLQAMKIIVRRLGRGNKSEGIRRALIETAARIIQRETVKMVVPGSNGGDCAEAEPAR